MDPVLKRLSLIKEEDVEGILSAHLDSLGVQYEIAEKTVIITPLTSGNIIDQLAIYGIVYNELSRFVWSFVVRTVGPDGRVEDIRIR